MVKSHAGVVGLTGSCDGPLRNTADARLQEPTPTEKKVRVCFGFGFWKAALICSPDGDAICRGEGARPIGREAWVL